MGISPYTADYIANLCAERAIGGSVLTLGRQDIFMDLVELYQILQKNNFCRVNDGKVLFPSKERQESFSTILNSDNAFFQPNPRTQRLNVSDYLLFCGLGFSTVESVDANPYEKCTYVHDFNIAGLSEKVGKLYDFVIDSGTSEHIFHQPNLYANVFSALRVGGFVLHVSPSNNYVDHGFYQFSPTFFFDWYHANNWKLIRAHYSKHTPRPDVDPWIYYTLDADTLSEGSFRGLDGSGQYMTFFCAQKTEESTCTAIPQQNRYRKEWANANTRRS